MQVGSWHPETILHAPENSSLQAGWGGVGFGVSVGNKPRRLTHPLERDPIMSKLIKALIVVACSVACTVACTVAGVASAAGAPSEKAKAAAAAAPSSSSNRFGQSVRPLTEAEKAHAAAVSQ